MYLINLKNFLNGAVRRHSSDIINQYRCAWFVGRRVLADWRAAKREARPDGHNYGSEFRARIWRSSVRRYSGDVTFISWKIRMTWPAAPKPHKSTWIWTERDMQSALLYSTRDSLWKKRTATTATFMSAKIIIIQKLPWLRNYLD